MQVEVGEWTEPLIHFTYLDPERRGRLRSFPDPLLAGPRTVESRERVPVDRQCPLRTGTCTPSRLKGDHQVFTRRPGTGRVSFPVRPEGWNQRGPYLSSRSVSSVGWGLDSRLVSGVPGLPHSKVGFTPLDSVFGSPVLSSRDSYTLSLWTPPSLSLPPGLYVSPSRTSHSPRPYLSSSLVLCEIFRDLCVSVSMPPFTSIL